ncbi:tyrosinase family oxidase copper chaperone [Streptomyces liangshanensis]|uniref:Tyrosinase n=1 Tax=Streptomyces liangshanensis TaxID=2717324 RepID=A0A6G9GT69_9ACTN|nr:tyrosinase family oxidase copper chaperone [Streptomyces liangshanensis]QIQ01137.1 tyrosinase [Streptomyces liangshanensis]
MPRGTQAGRSPLPQAPPQGGATRRGRTRRDFLRSLFTLGVVGGTAAVLAPVVRAGNPAPGAAAPGAEAARAAQDAAGRAFEELYQGRRIEVGRGPGRLGAGPAGTGAVTAAAASGASAFDIRIDGRPLHVMRRADGSYLSAVNHYESFPTLLDAARAAVDDLRGAQLSLSGPVHHV